MDAKKTIEVFFGKRKLFLTDDKKEEYTIYKNRKQLKLLLDEFKTGTQKEFFICTENLNELFINFKSIFVYEEAAGGLVVNEQHQVLVIKNRELWQLPKGHVEKGETYVDAAIREVQEECGISNPTIIKELPSTFHTFLNKSKWYLKRTYWFKMLYKGTERLVPQLEEGITNAVWIDKKNLWIVYDATYENLIEILELA